MKKRSKITIMDNDYFRKQQAKSKNAALKAKHYQHYRLFRVSIISLTILLTVVFGIRLITMHYQTQNINVQTEEANKKLEKVKAKNADLKEQIKQLNDEDYLRKLIREKYSYSKDNEIIYNLPTDVTKNIGQ
ncbi:FtsB family cell division protein [Ligilactobacillus salivarius]|uniref:FtsB family cell division protein n=1 Tax=Ligilactobacillus salivarius TaxID=1624 RepID=UPI0024B87C61|nr:septum formation initiator family protein [Ligilactobacillus salivarius]WHS09424.1 septum formation initiator family protein [Ligilactobacillus salivarius]